MYHKADNSEGIYKIKKLSELYGLIDDAGKTILDYNYFDIDEYFDSILVLRDSENKSGVMTIDKKIIIPLEHSQEIRPLRLNGEVYFKIIKDSKIAIFDGKGQNITGFRFDNLQSHTDETFFFQESSKWGIVSLSGKVIVPAKWLEVSQTMECYPNLVFKVKTKTEFEEIATYVGENGVEVKSKSPCNDMRLVKTGAGQTVEFRN